jgi:hypothetical protein
MPHFIVLNNAVSRVLFSEKEKRKNMRIVSAILGSGSFKKGRSHVLAGFC